MDYEKKYNEAMLRADEAVQKGCLDKDMFDIIFPPEESEDERTIRKIESFLSAYGADYFSNEELREIENWLEKQKEKEQKPAWSEEDEKKIHFLSRLIEFQVKDGEYCFGEGSCAISKQEAIEMLQSLRPCPSWKPSDHQMNILKAVKEYVGRGSGYWGEGLGSLIEDLEKLM